MSLLRSRKLIIGIFAFTLFFGMSGLSVFAAETGSLKTEINDINQEVEQKKKEVDELDSKIDRYKKIIMEKKSESASLQDQVALLENQIAKTQIAIEIAGKEIRALELGIQETEEKIVLTEAHVLKERRILGALARKLYRAQSRGSILELLLSHSSFSDFFDTLRNIASMQREVHKTLTSLQSHQSNLSTEKQIRQEKKLAIDDRKRNLEVDRRKLHDRQMFKENILLETKSSELHYRYMLADLKREQNEADSEITYLEQVLRNKIDLSDRLGSGETVLSWPLEPVRGLSSLFHDPDYPFRHVFEHPAIDIRAYQSTPVRAAASGIVARAKKNGYGYSYIMLIHSNNLSTVYGHVSKITIKEDIFVERGEIIGYSGGMPGTIGAGRMTTGPHLHFETRLRGIPVNPLNYLVRY